MTVANAIPGFRESYSFKSFLEMFAALESRSFYYREKDFSYMVPFGDIFNHAKEPNVKPVTITEKNGLANGAYIRAITDVPKGQQVNWNYGNKGNYEFLKRYGFVLTDGTQPISFLFI